MAPLPAGAGMPPKPPPGFRIPTVDAFQGFDMLASGDAAKLLQCPPTVDPEDMRWPPLGHSFLLMLFWLSALVLHHAMMAASRQYRGMSVFHRRNTITYILEVVVTSGILAYMLVSNHHVLTLRDAGTRMFTVPELVCQGISVNVITMLYMFELTYRERTNWPLVIHHLFAVTLSLVSVQGVYDCLDIVILPWITIFLFYAITEQASFVALLAYRLKWSFASPLLLVACISSWVTKTVFFALIWAMIAKVLFSDWTITNLRNDFDWMLCMRIMCPIVNTLLFVTQVYSNNIFWKLHKKTRNGGMGGSDTDLEADADGDMEASNSPTAIKDPLQDGAPRNTRHTEGPHRYALYPPGPERMSNVSEPTYKTPSRESVTDAHLIFDDSGTAPKPPPEPAPGRNTGPKHNDPGGVGFGGGGSQCSAVSTQKKDWSDSPLPPWPADL